MPVRKKDGKWYWGKQGPFDSKQKAEEVAQAAYASGYTKAWLTNPRGSTDDDKHGNADEERQQGFRYKKAMGGWGRGGQQEGSKPTIARSKNRKLDKDLSFGNPQGDSLKRGAYWDEQVEDDDKEESAVQKLMNYQQGRSTNHPSYPPTHGGLLGPKRIDWKKKRNTQPTEFVEKNVQKQVDLFDMPDFWLSKFIDIARQRGLEVILKAGEDEEEIEKPDAETSADQSVVVDDSPDDTETGTIMDWDTTTMGPMPEDKVQIRDVSQAPEGTKIIRGPRKGLYYIGDPTPDGANFDPAYHEAGRKFEEISDQLKTYHADHIAPLVEKIKEAEKASLSSAYRMANSLEDLESSIFESVEAYNKTVLDFPDVTRTESALDKAHSDHEQALLAQEKLMNEGVEQLIKLFSSKPKVDGVEIDMQADVQLNHEEYEDIDGKTHYIGNKYRFESRVRRKARETFENSKWGQNFIDDYLKANPDKDKEAAFLTKEFMDWEKNQMKLEVEDKHLGGYYTPSDHHITLNPYMVADLYGDDDTLFFDAMHTLTHEMVHAAAHGEGKRDSHWMAGLMKGDITGIQHVKRFGMKSPFSNASNKEMKFDTKHFEVFMDEAPTEAVSHIILSNRYGNDIKAASREEAANLEHLTSYVGYGHVMPTFARWALAKNNDSPKAARKEILNLLHTDDHEAVMKDFLHYMAIGTHANSNETVKAQSKASGNREVAAGLKANSWNRFHGKINLDAFENGELKQFEIGGRRPPVTIDPEDYIKYNKETFKTVPDDTDFKWLLYGERD